MAIFNSYVKLPEGTSSFYIGVQPIVDRGRLGRPGDDRRVPRPCGVRQYELLQWWTAGQWWTNSNGEELEPSWLQSGWNNVGIMTPRCCCLCPVRTYFPTWMFTEKALWLGKMCPIISSSKGCQASWQTTGVTERGQSCHKFEAGGHYMLHVACHLGSLITW